MARIRSRSVPFPARELATLGFLAALTALAVGGTAAYGVG